MRISDWSSDVCSSDLRRNQFRLAILHRRGCQMIGNVEGGAKSGEIKYSFVAGFTATILVGIAGAFISIAMPGILLAISQNSEFPADRAAMFASTELCGMLASILFIGKLRSEEHTSELQSLMRI